MDCAGQAGRAEGAQSQAQSRRTGGGALNDKQAGRIYQLILGKMPDQLKLPFYLWTRAAVAQLIEREFAVAVSLSTVGRYLKAWGLSAQRPVQRAYERNDAAIAAWLKQVYPRLSRARPKPSTRRSTGAMRWA